MEADAGGSFPNLRKKDQGQGGVMPKLRPPKECDRPEGRPNFLRGQSINQERYQQERMIWGVKKGEEPDEITPPMDLEERTLEIG